MNTRGFPQIMSAYFRVYIGSPYLWKLPYTACIIINEMARAGTADRKTHRTQDLPHTQTEGVSRLISRAEEMRFQPVILHRGFATASVEEIAARMTIPLLTTMIIQNYDHIVGDGDGDDGDDGDDDDDDDDDDDVRVPYAV